MFNQDISKYAFLKTFGEYGYGHMYATIYNLTEKHYGGPVLVVTSQIGTSYDPPLKDQEIYAWRWGAEAAHSRDVEADAQDSKAARQVAGPTRRPTQLPGVPVPPAHQRGPGLRHHEQGLRRRVRMPVGRVADGGHELLMGGYGPAAGGGWDGGGGD